MSKINFTHTDNERAAHEALRKKLWADMEMFERAGGKIDVRMPGESAHFISSQSIQSREANRRRAVSDKPLSSRQLQVFRMLIDNADSDGWVKLSEVYRGLSQGDRGNMHQYVQKIHDKGYISRGEKRGYVRIIRAMPADGTIKQERAGK